MVKDGFRVTISNATEGEKTFKGFRNKFGETFVEVWPEAEYFIDVQLVEPSVVRDMNLIQAHVFVDQQEIRFNKFIPLDKSIVRFGLKDEDGSRALRIVFPKLTTENVTRDKSTEAGSIPVCSQVVVCIHESIESKHQSWNSPCPTIEKLMSFASCIPKDNRVSFTAAAPALEKTCNDTIDYNSSR